MRAVIPAIIAVLLPATLAWGLPNEVHYDIQAELDLRANVIMGQETVTVTNRTGQELETLYFHVYPNAFKRGSSSHYQQELKSIAGLENLDLIYADPEDDAFMEIQSVTTGGRPLDFTIDDTLMTVTLDQPLKDGEPITLVIEFVNNLMEVPARGQMAATWALRSGYRNGVYTLALWYPKLAVYDGTGWNLEPYSYIGEFYGDFADYAVELTVPARYEVGATGQLASEIVEIGETTTKTLEFTAEKVHDFAWVASERYRTEELQIDTMTLRALYLDQSDLAEQALDALRYFGETFGPYAYETLTVAQVEAGGGMEYPGIVMIGSGSIREIAHEVAHQWWYGAVGNDEFDEAWLDEGFTTYADELYRIEALGFSEESVRSSYVFREPGEPVLQPASEFPSLSRYFAAVYTKGSGILWMLRGLLGPETFDRLLRTYYERFKYRNVATADFIATAGEIADQELDWFFDQWLRTTATLDFALEDVDSIAQSDGDYRHEITASRSGEAVMPVILRITDTDGEVQELRWEGEGTVRQFAVETQAPLESAILDPERTLLEENRENNLWRAPSRAGLNIFSGLAAMAASLLLMGWAARTLYRLDP